MSEQTATPESAPETIESVLDEATSLPEGQEASPAPVEAVKAEALQDKKDAGVKLTKKEEVQLKEYKLKVNGREKSVRFDPSNEAEVQKHLQKSFASDEAFQDLSQYKKAFATFFDDLKKNPKKALADPNIGIDLKKFAEEIMNEQIAEMEKSPEQREKEALKRELQEIKDQREKEKKGSEEKEMARIQAEHARNLESEISSALDIGGLPKTPRTVKHMSEMMLIAMQHGIELTAQEIAPIIKNTTLKEFKEVVNSLADDQLEDFLGKEVIGRLRKRNVAKAKAIDTASAVKSTGEVKKTVKEEKPADKILIRDFFKI